MLYYELCFSERIEVFRKSRKAEFLSLNVSLRHKTRRGAVAISTHTFPPLNIALRSSKCALFCCYPPISRFFVAQNVSLFLFIIYLNNAIRHIRQAKTK